MAAAIDFKYKVDENFDETIDEKGNTFIALRKINWKPDSENSEYKLDLRKYYSTQDGERMNKGVSFLTEEGPNELVKVLLEKGYGKSKDIITAIQNNRKDIFEELIYLIQDIPKDNLNNIINRQKEKQVENEDIYYDPREVI